MKLNRLSKHILLYGAIVYMCCFHSDNNTDYTLVLVELICHLRNSVAMVAMKLLIDCAQLMGIPTKHDQNGEYKRII